jgi:predicted flap endonuclease-1-like 5' DNA nuclease
LDPYEFKKERKKMKLSDIEGIGALYEKKLNKAGIRSTDALLAKGGTPKGRAELEKATGIGSKLILEWVNHADLYRIKGVGSEYADLLEEAGVDTIVELGQRKADNLHKAILAVNAKKKLVRRPPAASLVADWIAQAKKLKRAVQY